MACVEIYRTHRCEKQLGREKQSGREKQLAAGLPLAALAGDRDADPESDEDICCEPPVIDVLVVEDDAADFTHIERCLKLMPRYEARITLAGNLAAGQFAAEKGHFDAILVDYALGHDIGLDLVRSIGPAGTSPCILVTGSLTNEVEGEALDAGAVACIGKGELTPRLLETVLRQAVQAQEMRRTLDLLGRIPPAHDTSDVAVAKVVPAPVAALAWPELSAPLAGVDCVDAQSILVDAIRSARGQQRDPGGHAIEVVLQDRPVYVRADHRSLRRALDKAFHAFGRQPLTVAVQSSGAFNEILIEPAMVVRTGCDQGQYGGTPMGGELRVEEPGLLVDCAQADASHGPRLSVILPSASKAWGG